jgi:ribosomal protein S25
MSFYLKKSLKFGPVRFNLSKSGIGVSAGVKGFRVGAGPRGNYIHAGRGGIYYRKNFRGGVGARLVAQDERIRSGDTDGFVQQEASKVRPTAETNAAELVAELNRKKRRVVIWPLGILILLIVGVLLVSQPFDPIWTVVDIALAIGLAILFVTWDRRRRRAVLYYNLEPPISDRFAFVVRAFEQLVTAQRVFHISGVEFYSDRKYHAGVLQGMDRHSVAPAFHLPALVRTNIKVPAVPTGERTLYFLPDFLLVEDRNSVNAVAYSEFRIDVQQVRFVESEGVVSDTPVVGETWQYVNKSGGPDLRFRGNRRLPIVVYDELHFYSSTGLSERFHVSKPDVGSEIARALTELTNTIKDLQSPTSQPPRIAECHAQNQLRSGTVSAEEVTEEDEELVEKCLEIIRQEKRASTSLLQRRLRLGYTRAARIVDILEQRGILGPGEGAKPREILVDLDAAV